MEREGRRKYEDEYGKKRTIINNKNEGEKQTKVKDDKQIRP